MEGKNYINGAFVNGTSGERFESRNTANTDEGLGTFPLSSETDVNSAVGAANAAYDGGRKLSCIKRGEYFDKLVQL